MRRFTIKNGSPFPSVTNEGYLHFRATPADVRRRAEADSATVDAGGSRMKEFRGKLLLALGQLNALLSVKDPVDDAMDKAVYDTLTQLIDTVNEARRIWRRS
jgi:hypothetical protein